MSSVSIQHIHKAYGTNKVLKNVSLDIKDGEFIALVGPSGCGKSTLLKIIAGLESQTSGSIYIDQECIDSHSPGNRNLAMVFQSYALYPHLSVRKNIATPLRIKGRTFWQKMPLMMWFSASARAVYRDINQQVEVAAKVLGIADLLDRKPAQLSGGQRQRVALGRALVRDPAAFLLDEPLSNLDAKLRVQMRTEVAQLHRNLGKTFIYVTHDQSEAMTMADRIAVVMDGEIIQCDTPDVIYHSPKDIRVAQFIGSPAVNILPVNSVNSHLESEGVNQIGLRPEAIRINHHDGFATAFIEHIENLGSEYLIYTSVANHAESVVVKTTCTKWLALRGKQVYLQASREDMMFFDKQGKAISLSQPLAEVANG